MSTLEHLKRLFREAQDQKCSSIFLLMNTPGGVLSVTRKIVSLILKSDKPVLCLVYPSGAHAASAGAIIHQACHVNGAVKLSNIGAATPVTGQGKDISKDLKKKLINDMNSWLKSIVKNKKRSEKFVKDIVEDAKSFTAEEAFRLKSIDHVSTSKEDFLQFAHGRKVELASGKVVKVVVGPTQVVPMNLKERFLKFVSNPLIAMLLIMGSLFLIYFEITNPGFGVPGVMGLMGMILGFMNLEAIGVQWSGVLLMVLGVIFFIAEAFTPTFGLFSIAGGACFIMGGLLFFDPSKSIGMEIPLELIVSIGVLFTLLSAGLAFFAWKAFRGSRTRKDKHTPFQILSKKGEVVFLEPHNPKTGQIRISGEIWKFQAQKELQVGDMVKVLKTSEEDSLILEVEKI